MVDRLSIHEIEDEEVANTSQPRVKTIVSRTWRKLIDLLGGRVSLEEAIHPDFRIGNYVDEQVKWYQNKEWGPVPEPPYKICFYLNGPSLLDNCPWVCKIGNNIDPDMPKYKYFCVAYGAPHLYREGYGFKKMREWTMQFEHPRIMTYARDLVSMPDENL